MAFSWCLKLVFNHRVLFEVLQHIILFIGLNKDVYHLVKIKPISYGALGYFLVPKEMENGSTT